MCDYEEQIYKVEDGINKAIYKAACKITSVERSNIPRKSHGSAR